MFDFYFILIKNTKSTNRPKDLEAVALLNCHTGSFASETQLRGSIMTLRWYESGWRPCSQTCGKGIQRRHIVCRRKISQDQYEKVNDSSCDLDKPTGILQQECNKVSCPAEWKALAWSEVGVL